MTAPLRIGTRSSPLARWQADWVSARLAELGVAVEIVFITTQGDVRTGPLGQIGGQGLFTKEIQRALLSGEVDIAVHSLKDLPTAPVDGLTLGAIPERESPGDVLVLPRGEASGSESGRGEALAATRSGARESGNEQSTAGQASSGTPSQASSGTLESLPMGARLGTGSLRRRTQLLHARPDLHVMEIRGNVDTRLRKLDEGEYDAIVLAEAGLHRLGLSDRITQVLPKDVILPAVGQGALGIEIRANDERARDAVAPLNDPATRASVLAERALLAELRGGCLAPIGAWGRVDDGQLKLCGVVLSADGKEKLLASDVTSFDPSSSDAARDLGIRVAHKLFAQGAERFIADSRRPFEPFDV